MTAQTANMIAVGRICRGCLRSGPLREDRDVLIHWMDIRRDGGGERFEEVELAPLPVALQSSGEYGYPSQGRRLLFSAQGDACVVVFNSLKKVRLRRQLLLVCMGSTADRSSASLSESVSVEHIEETKILCATMPPGKACLSHPCHSPED